jgi:hypothetical protein
METPFNKEPLIAALFDSPDGATRVVEQLIEHDFPVGEPRTKTGALLHQDLVTFLDQAADAVQRNTDAVFRILEFFYHSDLHHYLLHRCCLSRLLSGRTTCG